MKLQKTALKVLVVFLFVSSWTIAEAADFDWVKDFNIKAEANLSEFKANICTRFNVGDAQVTAVLSNVEKPADAYMVFRLGEMAAKPVDAVVETYKSEKGKSWGTIAKSMGIKPGSKEFHALKSGDDLYNGKGNGKMNKGKGKAKK